MTSSKSNSWFQRVLVVLVALLVSTGVASANRKRLVVLDFEGDEAEPIHKSFVKMLKKEHTVIGIDKWNAAAEELGATKINEKNVKKVAKKLKVDGIITGNVEKRREEYIIRIKLRSGATGALVGSQINAKTDAPKLSKQAKTDIKDELYGQIDGLESVRGEGGEAEEEEAPPEEEKKEKDKPSKFGGKQMKDSEEGEEETPKLSKKEEEKKKKEEEKKAKEEEKKAKEDEKKAKEEEAKRAKEDEKKKKDEEKAALATKKEKKEPVEEGEEEGEENPLPKAKKEDKKKETKKKVAKTEEGEEEGEGIEEEADEPGRMTRKLALSPGNMAVDAVVGVSMNMRRMSFSYDANIGTRPAGYKGKLVPGGFLDMQFYPLALGHKRRDILKNIGATFMYDQVLLVKSKDAAGKELQSAQVRYAFGAVFRYPFSQSATSPVVGARLRYGSQSFKISQPAPLPSVTYSMIEPGVFFRMPLIGGKLVAETQLSFLGVTNAGQIQNMDKYGGATLTGFELNLGADYHLADALFLRGLFNYETIGYSFKKNGMLPTAPDNQKVSGARDTYYGVVVTAGYLF